MSGRFILCLNTVCVCVCVIPSEAAASLDSGACGEQPKASVAACCQFL